MLLDSARHELEIQSQPLKDKIKELQKQFDAASFVYEVGDVISWGLGYTGTRRRKGIITAAPDGERCYPCYTIRSMPKAGGTGTIIRLYAGDKSIRLEEQPVVPTVGTPSV